MKNQDGHQEDKKIINLSQNKRGKEIEKVKYQRENQSISSLEALNKLTQHPFSKKFLFEKKEPE